MNDVMVSVYVTTFNHENYIVRALDSILMQKTRYSMEVLVGEDCSTDNTRAVLKQWESEHPGVFQIFYRETNLYHSDCPNHMDLKLRCRGKYIICLEGDDFWTDPEKIEKQVTFLENHPEYYAVSHNCTVVGRDSLPNGEEYPQCRDTQYTYRHFASDIMPGQLATFLSRNYMMDDSFDRSLIMQKNGPGDRNIYFSIMTLRQIYCMQENMSAYRHITTEGSSYSATVRFSFEKESISHLRRIEFAIKYNNADAAKCARLQYLVCARLGLWQKQLSFKQFFEKLRIIPNWPYYLLLLLKRDFNAKILHKTPYI